MTKKAAKKELSSVLASGMYQKIPLTQLRPSPRNVRQQAPSGAGITELAESLALTGQLQNLVVTQAGDGFFDVEAGGRRLLAFKRLVKEKRIAKDHPVDCNVVPLEAALTASLTENTHREDMHPADQYLAIKAMLDAGDGPEDIAARLGITPMVVERRLKLANISPRLMQAFREDNASLEQLMALAITDDHDAQERAFFDVPDWQRRPHLLRAALTQSEVSARDPVAAFVTVSAYQAAGGQLRQDLFADDDLGGYLDATLVDRLATEKLAVHADEFTAEGWAWVEVAPRATHADLQGFKQATCARRLPTPEEAVRLQTMAARLEAIDDRLYGEDEVEDTEQAALSEESERLEQQVEALQESLCFYEPDMMALAGVVLSVGDNGTLQAHRGLVRREQEAAAKTLEKQAIGRGHTPAKPALSAKLVSRLTAHRTAALQISMARQPHVALAVVVHGMVMRAIREEFWNTLPVGVKMDIPQHLETFAPDLPKCAAILALEAETLIWAERLPHDGAALLDALLALSQDELVSLLALCSARALDITCSREKRPMADLLAKAFQLDMREWWVANGDNYFAHLPKAKLLQDIECFAPGKAESLTNLKKGELVAAAEKLAEGTGWLPPVLVTPDVIETEEAE